MICFTLYLYPYSLVLKATDEKPGTVWQRVSNSSTSAFFSQAITRNGLIFYESSAMKSEQVTVGKQFIDADREVSHDFMQDVLLVTNDARGGNQQIAHFGRHLTGSWTYLVE